MKIGICTGPDALPDVKRHGFDYAELAVSQFSEMDDAAFSCAAEKILDAGIPILACNVFLPRGLPVVGPNADSDTYCGYFKRSLARVSALGARTVVFGSGAARNCPDGYPQDLALSEFRAAVLAAGTEAAKHGICIAIEPLNRGETNIINTVEGGAELVRSISDSNVALLADFYHMRVENEAMSNAADAGAILRHTHIARLDGRAFPLAADEDDYRGFFNALSAGGYSGAVSIEGMTKDPERDMPKSLALLRAIARDAGL